MWRRVVRFLGKVAATVGRQFPCAVEVPAQSYRTARMNRRRRREHRRIAARYSARVMHPSWPRTRCGICGSMTCRVHCEWCGREDEHEADCPVELGVFPVQFCDVGLLCLECDEELAVGELFTYVLAATEDDPTFEVWAVVCLGCAALDEFCD